MGKPELAQKAVFIGREEVISGSVAGSYYHSLIFKQNNKN
jgi:hypothetical protein